MMLITLVRGHAGWCYRNSDRRDRRDQAADGQPADDEA